MTTYHLGEYVRFIFSTGKRVTYRKGWIIGINRKLVKFSAVSATYAIIDTNGQHCDRQQSEIVESLDHKQIFTMRSLDGKAWNLFYRNDPPEEFIGPYDNPVEAIDNMAGMIRELNDVKESHDRNSLTPSHPPSG